MRLTCTPWQTEVSAEGPNLVVLGHTDLLFSLGSVCSPIAQETSTVFHCIKCIFIVTSGKSQGYQSHSDHRDARFEYFQPQNFLKAFACGLALLSDHEQHNVFFKQYKGESVLIQVIPIRAEK